MYVVVFWMDADVNSHMALQAIDRTLRFPDIEDARRAIDNAPPTAIYADVVVHNGPRAFPIETYTRELGKPLELLKQ